MTLRAVLFGILSVAIICGLGYFNDAVLRQTYLVGNNFPIFVYGNLLIFLLVFNPLLRLLGNRVAFDGKELAVILTMSLAACCIPGSGLLRTFTCSLMLPHRLAKTEAGWKEQKVMDMVPPQMLADISQDEDRALNGFVQGLGRGEQKISLAAIPWSAWRRTLLFWTPILFMFWGALLALGVIVHKQWLHHEQLPYPIANFANALLPETNNARGDIFKERLFWLGAGVLAFIHLNNYAVEWFPTLVKIPLHFDFSAATSFFTTLRDGGWWYIFWPRLYFTVVAFAYFLATDVSLAMGVGPLLWAYTAGTCLALGINISGGGYMSPRPLSFLSAGAYLALFATFLYTGRHYYLSVAQQAVGLTSGQKAPASAIWAARIFAICYALLIWQVTAVGVEWWIAALDSGLLLVMFLVMSRICAETGVFFIQPYFFPCAILLGVFGGQALGPQTLLIIMMVSAILAIDPRESLLPFVSNALALIDKRGIAIGRGAGLAASALIIGLAIALPTTLYLQYQHGANMADGWATAAVPSMPLAETALLKQKLDAQGVLQESEALSGWARFAAMQPDRKCLVSFAIGLALTLIFCVGRLRYPGWPLHPVMFLIWATYPAGCFWFSFLIGWFIKVVVTKYGGAVWYQKIKPLMFGLIAGDMLGGVVPSLVSFAYYIIVGQPGKPFGIMPG